MYEISEEQINQVLAYLGDCRYKEVFRLVEMVKTLKKGEVKNAGTDPNRRKQNKD